MNEGKFVFAQLMEHLPLTSFHRCVQQYRGEYKIKTFSCLDQFRCMAFAQLTFRESLRDIEACLRAQSGKLYHLGMRTKVVARNTLAHANATRDWRIYAEFAQRLITIARKLYAGDALAVQLKETVYALDSTLIDLCLGMFRWTPSQQSKAGVRLHTLLDHARRHSRVHVRKPGTLRRNQGPRSASARTGRFLPAGSRLRGLCTFVSFPPSRQLLCDSSQVRSESAATFLAASRSQHGIDLRSDGCAQLSAIAVQLSAPVAPNSHARSIFGKHSGASDQPFRFACPDHLRAVPLSLADRAVLQVDKAAPSDQSILRYSRECSQNSDLDRSISVRAHRHRKEASQSASFTIRAPTTLEPDYVRANAATRPVNCISAPKPFVFNHSTRFIRLNVGTLLP